MIGERELPLLSDMCHRRVPRSPSAETVELQTALGRKYLNELLLY